MTQLRGTGLFFRAGARLSNPPDVENQPDVELDAVKLEMLDLDIQAKRRELAELLYTRALIIGRRL